MKDVGDNIMDKVADKALDLLKQLADRLGTTVEKLYPYFVRQVYLESITQLFGWLIGCAVVAIAALYLTRAARRKLAEVGPPDGDWTFALGLGYVVLVIVTILASSAIFYNLPTILNPDYEAVRRIVRTATGK